MCNMPSSSGSLKDFPFIFDFQNFDYNGLYVPKFSEFPEVGS